MVCFTVESARATHIRAGEITAKRINNVTLTYEFTFTGFRDSGSPIKFGDGFFDFGDGTTLDQGFDVIETAVGNEIEMAQFKVVHTFQAANSYVVSYEEDFRNEGIANMDNSVNTTFYVETLIIIDPFLGINNTPILTVPPIDFAAVGAQFVHNAGAFDPDGDSLSYSFVTPKQARGVAVNNYRQMIDPAFYMNFSQGNEEQNNAPSLTIDPITGDLLWDSPGDILNSANKAEYNVAFKITEWRYFNGEPIELGHVTRDMQIIVERSDNEHPTMTVPDNLCVEAGQIASAVIIGQDPDGHRVKMEAFGGPFEVQGSKATFSPNPANFQTPPGLLDFQWETTCGQIRTRPYEVQFKITDNPSVGPKLVDFQTMEITVVGPKPKGLSTTVQTGRSIQLDWSQYECTNAEKMEIWRRVGNFNIELDECSVGMPANTGYQKIDEIPLNQPGVSGQVTTYRDNNDGRGLPAGARYCYRLVASYPLPGGGKSYVSSEVCDSLIVDVPAITNVDVLTTDEDNGSIEVRWVPPYQIDQGVYPPAYTYDLFRSTGFAPNNSEYVQVASKISDTVFVDQGMNTFATPHHYFVRFYSGDILVDSSATASSTRLQLKPLLKSIEMTWQADVPWSNTVENYPYHYIYRDQVNASQSDQLVLIDSVDVGQLGYYYLDNGRFNDQFLDEEIEYCYFVSTNGTYDNPLFPEPLINKTQIACAQPNDTIPPCRPPLVIIQDQLDCGAILANQACGDNFFEQNISWTVDENFDCDQDIVSYNVYFSDTGLEKDFELLENVFETSLNRTNIVSIKGCYKVTAVDRSGNESEYSETICNDNCPVYEMPNVFTPNGDGVNDVFTPLFNNGTNINSFDNVKCPRFIVTVKFRAFDPSGNLVFQYDSYEQPDGIYINWDGTNKFGQDLPSGVYYYSVEVERDVLEVKDRLQTVNGWVQILR
ncbi:MAG: gliding motility-associated C-terminal domain-containing protein [Cyclobacteriaceae bacterium]